MNFLIFCQNTQLYSSARLLQEAAKLGFTTEELNPYQTHISYPAEYKQFDTTLACHRSTGIFYDDFDLLVSQALEDKGVPFFNSSQVMRQLRDKSLQAHFFSKHEINIVPTYALRGRPTKDNISEIKELFRPLNAEQFVVKPIRGNQGIGVNLINGQLSLASFLETLWAINDQRFIIQPYLENAREFRLLLAKDKILGTIEKSASPEDFRKNAKRGSGKYLAENQIPQEILAMAQQCLNLSSACYAGIDIIVHQNDIYLLELNLVPGFKMMEELSGLNIARELILSGVQTLGIKL